MLKFFYKTLLVSVLSGSLLMLNFSYTGSRFNLNVNSVYADTLRTESVDDSDLYATLTMVAVGYLTQRLWTCNMTTDMMWAAGAGAIFLAGEIIAYDSLKDVLKGIEKEYKRNDKGDLTQEQIDDLKRLKNSYEEAKKTATTKKTLQEAAEAAFLIAATMAGVQAYAEAAAVTACSDALGTAAFACDASYAAFTASCPESPSCALAPGALAGSVLAGVLIGQVEAMGAAALVPAPSVTKEATGKTTDTSITAQLTTMSVPPTGCAAAAPAVGVCQAKIALGFTNKGYCPVPLSVDNFTVGKTLYANAYTPIIPIKEKNNFFKNFLMSEARADQFSILGITSGVAIGFIVAAVYGTGAVVDSYLYSPFNRMMAWGVLAGLTLQAIHATADQISKLEENISKIDQILNFYQQQAIAMHAGNTATNVATINSSTFVLSNSEADISLKGDEKSKLPCATGQEKSEKCESFSNKLKALPNLGAMSAVVQGQLQSLTSVVDGVSNRRQISAATISEARKAGAHLSALGDELAKQKKALQDKLNAKGGKIDIEKESDKFRSGLFGAMKKELDSRKTTAGAMLASFGGMAKVAAIPAIATKNVKKKTAVNVVSIPAAQMPKLDDAELNAQLKGKKAAELAKVDASKTATSIDEYDLKNDITTNKDTSLFELISNRYQKSGYSRLFKKLQE